MHDIDNFIWLLYNSQFPFVKFPMGTSVPQAIFEEPTPESLPQINNAVFQGVVDQFISLRV